MGVAACGASAVQVLRSPCFSDANAVKDIHFIECKLFALVEETILQRGQRRRADTCAVLPGLIARGTLHESRCGS